MPGMPRNASDYISCTNSGGYDGTAFSIFKGCFPGLRQQMFKLVISKMA
jgi:hypothetical protein